MAVVLFVVVAGACSRGRSAASSNATSTTTAATAVSAKQRKAALATITHLTALGDSVPYGTACDCTPYPTLTAGDISDVTSHVVETSNRAVAGDKSTDVLNDVEKKRPVMSDVESSQAVTVEVGANDVGFSSTCGTDVSCYETALPALTANLDAIVRRLRQLTAGHGAAVVLLDYWSVWLGGQYAQSRGPEYVDAADALTRAVNDRIREVATSTHSLYVDLRTAFNGPDDSWDETHLLAPDGDHPNAAGHERIAQAIRDMVAAHP